MAKQLVDEELWREIAPLLPAPKARRRRYPGRKTIEDRLALTGIVFVLKTGIAWEDLLQELGCGSGMSCWRRMRAWLTAGVWDRLQTRLIERLERAERIDWSRVAVDSSCVRALFGDPDGTESGPPGEARDQTRRPDRRWRNSAGYGSFGSQSPRLSFFVSTADRSARPPARQNRQSVG